MSGCLFVSSIFRHRSQRGAEILCSEILLWCLSDSRRWNHHSGRLYRRHHWRHPGEVAWGSDKSWVRGVECLPAGKSVQFFTRNTNAQNEIMPAFFSRWTTTASTTSEKSRNENPTCTFTATRHKPTRPNVHVNIHLFYISFIYCIEHGGLGHTLGAFFSPLLPAPQF